MKSSRVPGWVNYVVAILVLVGFGASARADVNPTSIDPDPACLGQSLTINGSFGYEPSRYKLQIRPAGGGGAPLVSFNESAVNWSTSKLTLTLPADAVAPGTYRLTVDTFGEAGFGVLKNVQIGDCASGGGSGGVTPGTRPNPLANPTYINPDDLKGKFNTNPLGKPSGNTSEDDNPIQVIGPVREPDPAMAEALQRFRERHPYVDSSGKLHVPFDLQLNQELIALMDYDFEAIALGNPIGEGEFGQLAFWLRYYGDMGDRRVVVLITEPDTGEILGCTEAIDGHVPPKPGVPGRMMFWGYLNVKASRDRIQEGRIRIRLEFRDPSAGLRQGDCSTYRDWQDADSSNDQITLAYPAYRSN
jgi:hypothetical protein